MNKEAYRAGALGREAQWPSRPPHPGELVVSELMVTASWFTRYRDDQIGVDAASWVAFLRAKGWSVTEDVDAETVSFTMVRG